MEEKEGEITQIHLGLPVITVLCLLVLFSFFNHTKKDHSQCFWVLLGQQQTPERCGFFFSGFLT